MRRSAAVVATVLTTLGLAACGGGSSNATGANGAPAKYDGKPVTITFWNPFTGRQLAVMNSVIADFHKLYPKITVTSRGGITDNNIVAAIRGGSPPGPDDVAVRRQPRRVLRDRGVDQPRALHQT